MKQGWGLGSPALLYARQNPVDDPCCPPLLGSAPADHKPIAAYEAASQTALWRDTAHYSA